jgi:hypothetical protein
MHTLGSSVPATVSTPKLLVAGATILGMTAKEKVLEQAPDWTEEQSAAALLAAESTSESILVEDNRPARPQDEARIRRLQEISERFRRIDWPPREDAWH